MKDLVEKVARAIENEIAKRKGTFDSRDLSCASIRAVLEHFSEPGNVTEAMGIAWVKAMDWDEPSSADTIASAMRAALEEFKQ